MKKYSQLSLFLIAMVVTLSSCELVGDIFEAGFWTAIILIVVVIAIIIWISRVTSLTSASS
ncbi:MAG: phosphatidate cytidylyltransferase [Chitinophagaceae bacterium]